jgi:hypothetical protein
VAALGNGGAGRCVIDRLSALLDGDLPAIEASAVRAHLERCAACSTTAREMAAMIDVARTMERPEPPVSLWPAIAGKLDQSDQAPVRRRWQIAWPFGAGVALGAAAVVALVVGLGAHGRQAPGAGTADLGASARPDGTGAGTAVAAIPVDPLLEEAEAEFARAAAAYERSIEKLHVLFEREEARFTEPERAAYAERLARLDETIARSREAARRTPGDSAGNEQLFAAYQQKIAFLAAAVHRGGARGEPEQGVP